MNRKTVLSAAILTAGLTVAVPLVTAADTPQTGTSSEPRPSGIYALSTEQVAYYEGFLAGRGYDTDSTSPWVLSPLEIGALMREAQPRHATAEHGSITAIDHRADTEARNADAVSSVVDHGSTSAIDHAATSASVDVQSDVPSWVVDRGSINAIDHEAEQGDRP